MAKSDKYRICKAQEIMLAIFVQSQVPMNIIVFCNWINPIPTGLGHVTFIYGLIQPMAGRNRVNLFVTLKNEPTNSPIHQFTNLKCCIKAKETFLKTLS